jgi:hypothetical protein
MKTVIIREIIKMKIPKLILIKVEVLEGNIQRLVFEYKYRNAIYTESVYLTDYHLKGEVKKSTGPLKKDFEITEKDFMFIAIEMLYHNVLKNIEWLNRNRTKKLDFDNIKLKKKKE